MIPKILRQYTLRSLFHRRKSVVLDSPKRVLTDEETWSKILGLRQDCEVPFCKSWKENGTCMDAEYYEQFVVSGTVCACSRRGDGHLLNVTKKIGKQEIVERRRVPLPTGIPC